MQGLLSFCVALGAGMGGLLSQLVSSYYSRKDSGLVCAYVAILATLFLQSGNIFLMIVSRLVQGLYLGVTTVIRPVYIKEFSPLELSGKMGSIHQILFTFGLIYSFLQTYLL